MSSNNNPNLGFTQKMAAYIANADIESYSDELMEHAQLAFADWLAVSVVGRDEPVSTALLRVATIYGGNAQASVIAYPNKVSLPQAALINGSMSHALDYDDTLQQFLGHPTAAILPAVVALAESKGISGKQALGAYLLGLEVGCRLATALGPQHYYAGFHGTATVGRGAATAAACKLLGLNEQQIIYALGIAGTQSCGLKRSFGSMSKPMHAGMAAEGGINAALLAAEGFVSAEEIYEGQFGVFEVMNGEGNSFESADLPAHPVTLLTPKIHAACHCTHGPIEMIRDVAKAHNIGADDIQSVNVFCSQVSLDNANKTNPQTGLEAKFSINYSMANALLREDTGLAGYTDDKVSEPSVRNLMERISVEVDDEHREAGLKTTCRFNLISGEVVSRTLDPVEAPPSLEAKREQMWQKFRGLCAMLYSQDKVALLEKKINQLAESGDVGEIIQLTQELG